jgi:hypothetical protein
MKKFKLPIALASSSNAKKWVRRGVIGAAALALIGTAAHYAPKLASRIAGRTNSPGKVESVRASTNQTPSAGIQTKRLVPSKPPAAVGSDGKPKRRLIQTGKFNVKGVLSAYNLPLDEARLSETQVALLNSASSLAVTLKRKPEYVFLRLEEMFHSSGKRNAYAEIRSFDAALSNALLTAEFANDKKISRWALALPLDEKAELISLGCTKGSHEKLQSSHP